MSGKIVECVPEGFNNVFSFSNNVKGIYKKKTWEISEKKIDEVIPENS